MKKVLTLVLAVWMICAVGMASDSVGVINRLGSDLAGYVFTDARFMNFISNNVFSEDAAEQEAEMGYCQYYCMDERAPGMIMTMRGYTADMFGEGAWIDHLNFMANSCLEMFCPLYSDPDYKAEVFELTETQGYALLVITEQDKSNPMFFAFPYHVDGYYGYLIFESFKYEQEPLNLIVELISSYEHAVRSEN